MPYIEPDFPIAEALAADLAGAQVDPNEAQKSLAYLRGKPGDGRALFAYLDTVVSYGDAVIRSGRTLSYYKDLQRACKRHLQPLQQDYDKLLRTFAWSLRLLRYYRTVPDAAEEKQARRLAEPELPKPAAPKIPPVGEIFTGTILDLDDDTVLIEVPGFNTGDAIGVIKAPANARPRYRVGNAARVEVLAERITKVGRRVLELKPAPAERPPRKE